MDDNLRRISAALFAAGMLAVLAVANTGLVRLHEAQRAPLNWIVVAAGLSVVVLMVFPWHRYRRDLFLVMVLDGLGLVALAIYFSGGWESPFFALYFFVVLFSAIYFSPRTAAFALFLTVLASLSPQLYAPDASLLAEHVVVEVPAYLALAFVARYMSNEVAHRERLRAESEIRLRELRRLKDRLEREASTDHLTDLLNRPRFEARLVEEIEKARRLGGRFMVVFMDLDDFKGINDAYGHRMGDEALRLVASVLRANAREGDAVARYGGEEFVVLLSGASPSGAEDFFDRVRDEIAERSEIEFGITLRLSGGASCLPSDTSGTADISATNLRDDLISAADAAMYRAKQEGKNRLFHSSTEHS